MATVTLSLIITLVVVAVPTAFAVQHVVGDSSGWTNFGDYTTWASSNTFNVGDTLLFSYSTSHGVDVVSKADYDNCATSNALNSYTGGSTTIKLTQPGPMYFACPSFGHCSSGMKLAINVVSSTSNNNSPATTTTTPATTDNNVSPDTPSTTTTPSSTTPASGDGSKSANSGNHMVVVGFSLILAPLMFVFIMC